MNISLRRVKMNASQSMFITSTGTVLFTSNTIFDLHGHPSTTVVTSLDHEGCIVEVGFIKGNQDVGSVPSLFVKEGLVDWRIVGQDDSRSVNFRGNDEQLYRWRVVNGVTVLAAQSTFNAPIAIAYNNAQSSPVLDPVDLCDNLVVQPSGFHLLHQVVVTFILLEQLCWKTCTSGSWKTWQAWNPLRGRGGFLEDVRVQSSKDGMQDIRPVMLRNCDDDTRLRVPTLGIPHLTRFTADLTGELLRRYKYPSAYGGYGDIWKCDWIKDSRVIEVAVKVMRTNLTGRQREAESKRIGRELKVWVRLEHECVLPLYGISFDFGNLPAMVCPWLEGGTLSKYLEHHDGLQLHTKLQLLSDIADGLHYLHGCGIVHGDLTGSNVLIKDNGKACLSDFGLSRIFMEATGSSYLTSTVRGSVRWAAPELFQLTDDQQQEPAYVLPSPQSDIYSFGSTMLQVLTGKVPYHYFKNDAQVLVALSREVRPLRPDEPPIDNLYWEFLQRCWSSLGKRPRIEEIVSFLLASGNPCSQGARKLL